VTKPLVRGSEPERHYLSTSQAARQLGVSRWTVRRMVEDGDLGGILVRGMLRVDEESVSRYIATHGADGGLESRKRQEARDDEEEQA
jgi:excisionase family DNA binding protein